METTIRFDLNKAIQQWRADLAQSPAFGSEDLNELESHLRDSVVALQSRGLAVEEAFEIAVKRIGKEDSLNAEFAKVNANKVWLDRLLWMLIGIQLWGWVAGLMSSISSGTLTLGLIGSGFNFGNQNRTITVVLFTLVRLLAVASSLALCWWLIVRRGDVLGSRIGGFLHRRATLAVIGGVLCLILWSSTALGYGSIPLLIHFVDMKAFGELTLAATYANAFAWLVQTFVLVALTLMLARKRLRATLA